MLKTSIRLFLVLGFVGMICVVVVGCAADGKQSAATDGAMPTAAHDDESTAAAPQESEAPEDVAVGVREVPTDQKIEVVEQSWPIGRLRMREHIRRDAEGKPIRSGLYTRWHENGNKEYECVFVNGLKHGVETRWHRNGKMWSQATYHLGEKHGVTTVWDQNGNRRKEEMHCHGEPCGTWTVWNSKGKIRAQRHPGKNDGG